MPFTDLDELLQPWLDLPIKGKTYRVAAADAETGLWCQRVDEIGTLIRVGGEVSEAEAESLKLDDDEEKSFVERMLPGVDENNNPVAGKAYGEMVADRIPWEQIRFAARVVFTWTIASREEAEALWERGGRPEGRRPARKKPAKKK